MTLLNMKIICPIIIFFVLIMISGCTEDDLPVENSLLFGAALEGLPDSTSVFHELEEETGFPLSLVNIFLQWPGDPEQNNYPGDTLRAVHEFGAIPVLTWEPIYYEHGVEHMIPAQDILDGVYDQYIGHFALRIRELGGQVIIRFAHEMNLSRYHWGSSAEEFGPDSPERYQAMFRHVAGIFHDMGAANALFAFCPNNESLPSPEFDQDAGWNRISRYYPGDEYVDVLGIDGYNWGTTRTLRRHGWESRWKSFEEIFYKSFHELKNLAPDKPVFIFETASTDQGGDRSVWIRDAFLTAADWGIKGLVWFHVDKEEDWRLLGFRDSEHYADARSVVASKDLSVIRSKP